MMDQMTAASRPAVLGQTRTKTPMLKGMAQSPLESVLIGRKFKGMPRMSMSNTIPTIHMSRMGVHENQPKIKPAASIFHSSLGR